MADLAERTKSASVMRALLSGAIDYAGLFPPASLSMQEAVRNYAEYSTGAHAWALGRFVVPVARLTEFHERARHFLADTSAPWRLSVLAGAGGADEWKSVEANRANNCVVDAIELRARTPADVLVSSSKLPSDVDAFYEIPINDSPTLLIEAIAQVRRKAKVRTGGVTPDAFPSARKLARFIVTCVQMGVPFKATAGLHHPLRATYRLTYEPDSPRGEMFGFLNVLLSAAFASNGLREDDAAELLVERDAASLRVGADGVSWRGWRVSVEELAEVRATAALSFGSCSFTEPIAELKELGLL